MIRRGLKATLLIPAILSLGMSGSKACLCGSPLNDETEYQGPTSDPVDPAPRVIAIKSGPKSETVQIAVSIPTRRETATRQALFTSSNHGKTWTQLGTRTMNVQEVYRPTVRYRSPLTRDYLERSTDNGRHWAKALLHLNTGDANGGQRKWTVEIAAVHPTNPLTIYGCFAQPGSSEPTIKDRQLVLDGIYKSIDGGDHWSLFTDNFHPRALEERCMLGINPSNPEIMLLHGRSGLVMSRDAGKSWKPVGEEDQLERPARLRGYSEAAKRLTDKKIVPAKKWPFDWTFLSLSDIVFQPGSVEIVYLLTNKGLFKTTDGGSTWCLIHSGFDVLFGVDSIFIDEREPSRIFVGLKDKILISSDGGCHFSLFFDSKKLSVHR